MYNTTAIGCKIVINYLNFMDLKFRFSNMFKNIGTGTWQLAHGSACMVAQGSCCREGGVLYLYFIGTASTLYCTYIL